MLLVPFRSCRSVSGSSTSSALHAFRRRFYRSVTIRSALVKTDHRVHAGKFTSRDSISSTAVVVTCYARHFSTAAPLYSTSEVVGSKTSLTGSEPVQSPQTADPVVDLTTFESSAHAKWASDAAAANITELAPQGDLASLGLCANTPVGWLQYMLEYIHIHADLPWWGAIVASTFILRAVIFPVVMKIQKNGVCMNNINPEIQKLMKRQREYRQMGNKTLADQYSHKIWNLYQKHNCNPLKMAVMPLIQVPLFVSFFIAIRKMAAVPVESMKTGGALWFYDLTVPDPYYVLPVLACGSFVASIEVGILVCCVCVCVCVCVVSQARHSLSS